MVRDAAGEYGVVQWVTSITRTQPMYNLTVAVAHTFFVGDGQWLVHNACGHHPLPKYLGGQAEQKLTDLTGLHSEYHNMLRAAWRDMGFPPEGGPTGSAKMWDQFMIRNPGSQKEAFDTLLSTARELDYAHGTNLVHDIWDNIVNGRFNVKP